jgi:hypothetical protein
MPRDNDLYLPRVLGMPLDDDLYPPRILEMPLDNDVYLTRVLEMSIDNDLYPQRVLGCHWMMIYTHYGYWRCQLTMIYTHSGTWGATAHGKMFSVIPLTTAVFSFWLRCSQSKPRCHWWTADNHGCIYRDYNKPQITAVAPTANIINRNFLVQTATLAIS